MNIIAIVPVKRLNHSKTRLASFLNDDQRVQLGYAMLHDVTEVLRHSLPSDSIVVITPDSNVLEWARLNRVNGIHEQAELGVNVAVAGGVKYAVDQGADSVIIVPSDLPLLRVNDVNGIMNLGLEKSRVVIAPSLRFDGTNILLLNPATVIKTSYDRNSFMNHLREARRLRVSTALYVSKGTMLDIDTVDDIHMYLQLAHRGKTVQCLHEMKNLNELKGQKKNRGG